MLSAVAKAYLALAVVVGVFTLVHLNPVSFGGGGGGGDHFGATLLVVTVIGALGFAVATSLRSVTDHEVEPPVPADAPAPSVKPVDDSGPTAGASAFPLIAAAGLVLVGVAASAGALIFYLAAALLFAAAAGWLGQTFVEHPFATARAVDRFSRRTVSPFAYPALAVLLGAIVAISVSRVYLTITENAAIVVSALVATVLFLGCLALASGRNVGRRLTAGLAGMALVSVIGAGAASGARGERAVEHHEEPGVTEQDLKAQGIQYDKRQLTLTEGKVRFTFDNDDPKGTFHDVGIYSEKEAGRPFVAILPTNGGRKASTLIDTRAVGLVPGTQYWFRCDFHPAMVGTVEVEPAPAEQKVEKP